MEFFEDHLNYKIVMEKKMSKYQKNQVKCCEKNKKHHQKSKTIKITFR